MALFGDPERSVFQVELHAFPDLLISTLDTSALSIVASAVDVETIAFPLRCRVEEAGLRFVSPASGL